METYIVELNRPNKSITWGFSIQGGKDFGCPLSVLRITPNSISDKASMNVQDLIIKINDIPTDTLSHQQAILQIQNLNVKLELSKHITEITSLPPPPSNAPSAYSNFRNSISITDLPLPPPELINPNQTINNSNNPVFYPPPPPPLPLINDKKNTYEPPKVNQQYSGSSNIVKNTEVNKYDDSKPVLGLGHFLKENLKKPQEPFQIGLKYTCMGLPNISKNLYENPEISLNTKNIEQFLKKSDENTDQKRDYRDLKVQGMNIDSNSPVCVVCKDQIKGTYLEASNKIYCAQHFCCSYCKKPMKGNQYIETKEGTLYCMDDYTNNIAPRCGRCSKPIIRQQIMALNKCWHPECFQCNHCKKPIPQGQFHIKEENNEIIAYCEKDFKEFYEVKCHGCKLVIDSDDKYVQVSGNNYHVECFKR